MSQVKKGDNVQVHYTGRLNDGTVFDSSQGREPLAFTVGAGQMIQGFDKAVVGMSVGDNLTVTIPSAEAYGEYRSDLVIVVPSEQFPEGANPQVGDRFAINQENGYQIPVIVTEVNSNGVTLDANHELAGKELIFDIQMVSIS